MSYQELYEKGMESFEREDYQEARKNFEELVAGGYKFADVLNKLAFIMSLNGELEKAVEFFKAALEINPRYSEAAINLSYVLSELGRYEEANEVREKMKSFIGTKKKKNDDPFVLGKIANLHGELGERYIEIGWDEDAVEEYKKAIKLRPAFVDLRTRLAVLEREQGRIEDAIEHLTQSLLENPNYLPGYIQLGLTYYVMGEKELAKKQWENVLAKDPDNSVVNVYLNMLKKKD